MIDTGSGIDGHITALGDPRKCSSGDRDRWHQHLASQRRSGWQYGRPLETRLGGSPG